MKSSLFLLILLVGGGAGYEIYLHQQQTDNFRQQRTTLTAKIDELTKQRDELLKNSAIPAPATGASPSLAPPPVTNASPAAQ